jgi:tetraacyldisaccharide 4'-kinase
MNRDKRRVALEKWLWQQWQRRGYWARLLWPLSLLYVGLLRVDRWRQRRLALQRPVRVRAILVVGNLTVGGSGKTPMTLWLAERLRAEGYRVGIVSRGHGRMTRSSGGAVQADSHATEVGDEPLLLARRSGVPVWVDHDRLRAVWALAEHGVEVILSDDGWQHHRLRGDLHLLMVDGQRRFGNGWCLPAGPLREPLTARARADFTVCVEGEPQPGEYAMTLAGPDCVYAVIDHAQHAGHADPAVPSDPAGHSGAAVPSQPAGYSGPPGYPGQAGSLAPLPASVQICALQTLARQGPVHAVAGIADPERFFRALESRGLTIIRHPFPDHHPYRPQDLRFPDDLPVLMTEKDAVKYTAFADTRHWFWPVTAQIDSGFATALLSALHRRINASPSSHWPQ